MNKKQATDEIGTNEKRCAVCGSTFCAAIPSSNDRSKAGQSAGKPGGLVSLRHTRPVSFFSRTFRRGCRNLASDAPAALTAAGDNRIVTGVTE